MYLDGPKGDVPQDAEAGLVPQLGMMIRALLASPVRNTLFLLGGHDLWGDRRHGLWPDPAQSLEPAFL